MGSDGNTAIMNGTRKKGKGRVCVNTVNQTRYKVIVEGRKKKGNVERRFNPPANVVRLILQQEIPIDSHLRCLPRALEHAFPRLLPSVLRCAFFRVPHLEQHALSSVGVDHHRVSL